VLRGIEHLIFFALPTNHHFYPELANMVSPTEGSCTVIFSKYDLLALQSVVGADKARKMISSPRANFMILSGK